MERKSMTIGDLEIIPIYDGWQAYPMPDRAKGKSDEELAVHRDYIPGDGTMIAQFGAFLVRTGGRVVLLDAGMGPACGHCGTYHAKDANPDDVDSVRRLFRSFGRDEDYIEMRVNQLQTATCTYGELANSLSKVGVDPAEITDVVLSHLHCDHMGWVSRDGQPFFPKADIWCHEADAEYFLGAEAPDETHFRAMYGVDPTKVRMAPAVGQLRTWDKDCTIAPGIDVRHLPGHTPGSSITYISSQGERAMMTGDVVHCPLEMTDEDFSIMADLDPALAHKSKLALIQEVEDGSVHVASPHFPGMRFGRLLKGEGKRYWTWN
jgi:glyoxylase-like metal-dependent hydrolase (beta-lactamase superfamily II)